MKRITKIIIIIVLIVSVIGIWGYKTYVIKKEPKDVTETPKTPKTAENMQTAETTEKGKPMLLDLGSSTCIPCREMVPILDEVKKMYSGKAVVKVMDVYDNPEVANKYGIRVVPTQIFLDKDGKEVSRHEGFFSTEEIVKVFRDMGVE